MSNHDEQAEQQKPLSLKPQAHTHPPAKLRKKRPRSKRSFWAWLIGVPLEIVGFLFLLLLASVYLVRLPSIQTFIVAQAIGYVSAKTETRITADSIYIDVFDKLYFENLYVEDWDCDTLLYTEKLALGIYSFDIWKQALHLKSLDADGMYVNLHREKGEMLNINYVLSGLSSKKSGEAATDTTAKPVKNSSIKPSITAERLHLRRLRFGLDDGESLTQLAIHLREIDLKLHGFDIADHCFEFDRVLLDQPVVSLRIGDKPDKPDKPSTDIVHITPKGWTFDARQLQLRDGAFALTDEGSDTTWHDGNINFKKLRVSRLEGNATNLHVANDTIFAASIQLAAREQSGFDLQRLQSSPMTFTARGFELQNLYLQTPNSRLGDYLQMKYRTLEDFSDDFVNRVRFKARFTPKSVFKFRDINYFADDISREPYLQHNLDLPIYVHGEIGDKVNNISARKASIGIGNTRIEGDFSINGLPDVKSSFIDCKITRLTTSVAEIRKILPPKVRQKIPAQIDPLGNIAFNGSFTGFPSNFVAYGDFKTNIGQIKSDLKMDLRSKAKYSGDIAATDFALGTLLHQKDLGNITFSANVDGQGFNLNELLADIDARVERVAYKGYTYQNINIDGNFDRKFFSGDLAINDPNANVDYFKGTVNFNTATPELNFKTAINRLDLRQLGLLSPEQEKQFGWVIAGKTEIDLKGNNLDNIEGKLKLENLALQTPKRSFNIERLEAASFFLQGKRELVLWADMLNARLNGDFNFKDFVPSVQRYLHHYFPYRFPYVAARPQEIDFVVDLNDPKGILKEFVPQIDTLPKAILKGNFDSANYNLNLTADIKHAVLSGTGLYNFQFDAQSDPHDLRFDTQLDSLHIKGAPNIPLLDLSGIVYNDTIDFELRAAADTAAYNAHIDGLLFANRDTLTMRLDTTILVSNYKAWKATTGMFIYKDKNYFKIEDLLLAQGDQRIALSSYPDSQVNNKTTISLDNINLMDFSYIKPIGTLGIETQISGDVDIDDLFGKQLINAQLLAANFVFRGQKIGDINLIADKEKSSNHLNLGIEVGSSHDYEMSGKGYVALPEKKGDKVMIDVDADIKRGNLRFLEAFLSAVVSDTEGEMRGNLSFKGNIEHPAISGQLLTRNAATTVDYLQTRYQLHNQIIQFDNSRLRFDDIILTDRDQNTATLSGMFNLGNFKNMFMDIRMETNNFLFLDTKIGDNDAFYGTAYGKGYMTIRGPVNKLDFYINATSNRGTAIYLPLTGEVATSDNRIYTFMPKHNANDASKPKRPAATEQEPSGMRVNLDLDITPDAELQMIFNYQAGDIIRARGKGNMQMNISTIGDFTYAMYGRYEIEQGSYNFTLQNIINKHFVIEQGGTIVFSGNPYDAQLNMNAVYDLKASRSDFLTEAELTTLTDNEQQELKRRSDIAVALNLSGILSKPDIKFNLRFPQSQATRADDLVQSKLNEMLSNDVNELNRQVFGLLVLNRFMPPQRLDFDVKSGSLTTLSEFVSSYLSGMLNEILPFIPEGGEIGVAWRNYDNTGSGTLDQTNAQGNEIELTYVQKVNDRVEVQVGGNVDISQQGGNSVFGGDFVVSYKITPDGRVKLKAFGKYDNDLLTGEFYKAGGSLLLSKEFDSLDELFRTADKVKK